MSLFVRRFDSSSDDPYRNIAMERILMESGEDVFGLYINRRCVVTGRHQNPWLECNLARMDADGIPLVRRTSGGGTVFHDPGNVNYFCIMARAAYRREAVLERVAAALAELGVTAEISAGAGFTVDGLKIGGSAFQMKHGRVLHHGTLLVASDLEGLEAYIHSPLAIAASKGIRSVRAEVVNLRDFLPGLSLETMKRVLASSLASLWPDCEVRPLPPGSIGGQTVELGAEELRSWEWCYGKSPEFSLPVHTAGGRLLLCTVRRGRLAYIEAAPNCSPHAGMSNGCDPDVRQFLGQPFSLALLDRLRRCERINLQERSG